MTCRFEGTIPIVCCPSGDTDQPATSPIVAPPPVTALPSPPNDTALQQNVKDVCGFATTLPRILYVMFARKGAWPWMAAIFIEDGGVRSFSSVSCAGALISHEFVLTAAHCTFLRDLTTRRLPSDYTIRFGDLGMLSKNDVDEITEVGVLEVIPHPDYDFKKIRNDIALLRIDKPIVTFTKSVRPVCLPSPTLRNENLTSFAPYIPGWDTISTVKSEYGGPTVPKNSTYFIHVKRNVDGGKCFVNVGWHILFALRRAFEIKYVSSEITDWYSTDVCIFIMYFGSAIGGNSSNILRELQVQIFTNEQCKQSYSRFKQPTIEPNQLCAGLDRGGKDACMVDSGGPLTSAINGRWTIIGVFSFGFRCADSGFPGVYTRMTEYIDWVLTNARMQ